MLQPEPVAEPPPEPVAVPPEAVATAVPPENVAAASDPLPEAAASPAPVTAPPEPVVAALPPETVAAEARTGGGTPGAPADYFTALQAWLERHKEYPRQARLRRQEGTVLLSFTFDRAGRVLGHRIERSSGHAALDREVAAMLVRAQPLPPIPDAMTQARLEITVPVQFALR